MNCKYIEKLAYHRYQRPQTNGSPQTILLHTRQTRKIILLGDSSITARSGYCWITSSQSRDDIVLGPGQVWETSSRLEVITSALGERPCELEITGKTLPSTLLR